MEAGVNGSADHHRSADAVAGRSLPGTADDSRAPVERGVAARHRPVPEMHGADQEPSGEEHFLLWVLIAQTRDAILRARERDYARYGISNERRAVLYFIRHNGGEASPVEIARGLFRELNSVTGMLKRMERDELVVRTKGRGRSRVLVKLTEKGSDVFRQSQRNETDQRIFSVLTLEERERLVSYLWKLRGKGLESLGIPEWQHGLHLGPTGGGATVGKSDSEMSA